MKSKAASSSSVKPLGFFVRFFSHHSVATRICSPSARREGRGHLHTHRDGSPQSFRKVIFVFGGQRKNRISATTISTAVPCSRGLSSSIFPWTTRPVTTFIRP